MRLRGSIAALLLAPLAIAWAPSALAQTGVEAAPASTSIWSTTAARDLVEAIDRSSDEGLRPQDYGLAPLRAALAEGAGPALDRAAQASGLALARDYLLGRITDREMLDWHIALPLDQATALPAMLDQAAREGRIRDFLQALLPSDARYAALRQALAEATDDQERAMLRVNLERARWMPRAASASFLYVNVPSYRLVVVDNGTARSTYTVVVGAADTPTPQMISDTGSLVVNPWWNVPQSIVQKSALRPGHPGFVFKAAGNGQWQVRQPPGPRNSLGRIKFNLVNDQAIYLHDTPAKSGFRREARALSHGCIRIKDIEQLAAELMEDGGVPGLDRALARTDTATLRLPRTWPVQLVYFTADLDENGQLVRYGDPYKRDAALLARLDGAAMQIASN